MADYCFAGARYLVLHYGAYGLEGATLVQSMLGAKQSKRSWERPANPMMKSKIIPVNVLADLEEADETLR